LSRACLGKKIAFIYKWLKTIVLRTEYAVKNWRTISTQKKMSMQTSTTNSGSHGFTCERRKHASLFVECFPYVVPSLSWQNGHF
jgi:hypothetical protein